MRAKRVFHHGESLVAAIGLPGVCVLLLVTAMSSGWGVWTAARGGDRATAGAAHEAVGAAIESMLASGDASGVRRTVAALGGSEQIASAQVTLGDGRVLAHSEAKRITISELPETWEAGGAPEPAAGALALALEAPGRGSATLLIEPSAGLTMQRAWSAAWGLAAIGVIGLGLYLTAYRLARKSLASMGAVRESLLALDEGERSVGTLRVDSGVGPEGRAWNALLTELEESRRRLANDALSSRAERRSDRGLEQVCDAMWHGVLLIDDDAKIVYANNAVSGLIGAGADALAGRSVEEIEGFARIGEFLVEASSAPGRGWRSAEIERDGGGVLRVSVRRVRREDDASALALLEDVSQRRIADAARQSFVANATHELRTPLTNMRMYLETALDEGERDAAARAQALNVIGDEIRRLERIVGDMLSVTEMESGSLSLRLDDVRLDALVQQAHDDFVAQASEKGLSLRLAMAPKLPTLHGDRDRIAQAVHNLLGNAVKYTPTGGGVTVSVEPTGGGVSIEVRDTGIGMSEQAQSRVFEQFYRADDARLADIPGSGLGLALAREIARRHGGDITVESALDEGSAFTMWLPERADAPARAAA